MLSPNVKQALCDLGNNFEKTLGAKGLELWERELEGFDDEGILQACRKVMDDPEVKYMPRIGEFKVRIPKKFWPVREAHKTERLAWWHICGDWGGNWSECHDEARLSEILAYVVKHGDESATSGLRKFLIQQGGKMPKPEQKSFQEDPFAESA